MDIERKEKMMSRKVTGRRLDVSGRDVIKACMSESRTPDGSVIDMYLRLIRSLGQRESVFYFSGDGYAFKMPVSEEDYWVQLTTVVNILNFGECLSLDVVTRGKIDDMESDGNILDEVKCIDLLYHIKKHGSFDEFRANDIEEYIKVLENKWMLPNPPKWMV